MGPHHAARDPRFRGGRIARGRGGPARRRPGIRGGRACRRVPAPEDAVCRGVPRRREHLRGRRDDRGRCRGVPQRTARDPRRRRGHGGAVPRDHPRGGNPDRAYVTGAQFREESVRGSRHGDRVGRATLARHDRGQRRDPRRGAHHVLGQRARAPHWRHGLLHVQGNRGPSVLKRRGEFSKARRAIIVSLALVGVASAFRFSEAPARDAFHLTTPGILSVMNAASIPRPMRAVLDSFAARPGAKYELEPGASLEIARRLTELHRTPDVVLLADPEVFPQLLMPQYVRWYALFARNRIVLAYTASSRGAARINGENWRTVITQPGVEVGRADPNTDPSGYRANW